MSQWPKGPPPEVLEAWSRNCRCCPCCRDCPCAGVSAGGMCDDVPCRYDRDEDHLDEDGDSE